MGRFRGGSLNPPAHPPAVVVGGGTPPPASCLIDRVAYIANVTNASTAYCYTTDYTDNHGVTIQVTFVVGDPPQVSYLCTSCIGSQFAYEPVLVATEGRYALLAIDIGRSSSGRGCKYYIYYAGDTSRRIDPSLKRLPDPDPVPQSPHRFYDGYHLGLLMRPRPQSQPQPQGGFFLRPHCSHRAQEEEEEEDVFLVAGLFRKHRPSATGNLLDLYLYSSDTNKWSIKELPLLLDQQRVDGGFDFKTNKAISIGGEHGGTMYFVDLKQGILQCDVLDGTPGLSYYPMPPPLEPKPVTMVQSYPQFSRDVAIIDGGRRIKCVQLHLDVTLNCEDSNWGDRTVPSYHGWKAATWSMDTAHPSSGWRQDSEVVHASEVGSTIDSALLKLPPYEFDDGEEDPPFPLTFEKLHTSLPVISLHDNGKDVVYFMTKVHGYHKAALVLAVDMSNKTAQVVTQFLPGKFMAPAFVHSRISKYLSMAPAPAPGTRGNLKRPGMMALTACSRSKQHSADQTKLGNTVEQHQGRMQGLEPCTASVQALSADAARCKYTLPEKYQGGITFEFLESLPTEEDRRKFLEENTNWFKDL